MKKRLTNREKEVLELMSKGYTNLQIADKLVVSSHTIKAHVSNILKKLEVNDRINAIMKGLSENIIELWLQKSFLCGKIRIYHKKEIKFVRKIHGKSNRSS